MNMTDRPSTPIALDRTFTTFAILLLDTLPPDGMPEHAVSMAFDLAGLGTFIEGREAVRHLVLAGLLARAPGPRLVPGPLFATTKVEVERARQEAR